LPFPVRDMPTLIAVLSSGKGTWSEVNRIMQSQSWSKIFLITNQFGRENFTSLPTNAELIVVDFLRETQDIAEDIKKQLHSKVSDLEVALNIASGTGKEHMAVMEAVLELGLNFRLVTVRSGGQLEVLGLRR